MRGGDAKCDTGQPPFAEGNGIEPISILRRVAIYALSRFTARHLRMKSERRIRTLTNKRTFENFREILTVVDMSKFRQSNEPRIERGRYVFRSYSLKDAIYNRKIIKNTSISGLDDRFFPDRILIASLNRFSKQCLYVISIGRNVFYKS